MKLNNIELQKVARRLFRGKQHTTTSRLFSPTRDWAIGLLVGITILCTIMGWSAYMFLTHRTSEVGTVSAPAAQPSPYREGTVHEALGYFADRESIFTEIRANPVPNTSTPVVTPEPPVPDLATSTPAASSSATTTDAVVASEPFASSTPTETVAEPVATDEPEESLDDVIDPTSLDSVIVR